jgi:hypothetical protein
MPADHSDPVVVERRPVQLRRWQRWGSGLVGLAAAGGGSVATFLTDNQGGSVALVLVGALGLLMALTGRVPDRIGRDGVVFDPVGESAIRALNSVLSDETVPLAAKAEASLIVEGDSGPAFSPATQRGELAPERSVADATPPVVSGRQSLRANVESSLFRYLVTRALETGELPPGAQVEYDVGEQTQASGGTPIRVRIDAVIRTADSTRRDDQIAVEIITPLKWQRSTRRRVENLQRAGFRAILIIGSRAADPGGTASGVEFVEIPESVLGQPDLPDGSKEALSAAIARLWRIAQTPSGEN